MAAKDAGQATAAASQVGWLFGCAAFSITRAIVAAACGGHQLPLVACAYCRRQWSEVCHLALLMCQAACDGLGLNVFSV